MSDMRRELERLRREVDQLLAATRLSEGEDPAELSPEDLYARRVQASVKKDGESIGTGVFWTVILADGQGGSTTINKHSIWTGPIKTLPPEQNLTKSARVLALTPFQMRALHKLLEPAYELKPKVLTKAVLANATGVSETDLESELRPLIANETLRWLKTPEGAEAYELLRPDLFLLQLSLAV